MLKKIVVGLFISFISIGLSGCLGNNVPEPKIIHFSTTVPQKEAQALLNYVVAKHVPHLYNNMYFGTKNGCVTRREISHSSPRARSVTMAYCYRIESSGIVGKYSTGDRLHDNSTFTELVNNFTKNIQQYYSEELEKYNQFEKNTFKKYMKNLHEELTNISVSTIDKTNIIDSGLMKTISKDNKDTKHFTMVYPKGYDKVNVYLYKNYKTMLNENGLYYGMSGVKLPEDYFYITYKNPIQKLNRYKFTYEKNNYWKCPNHLNLEIVKVDFNYLPKMLKVNNNDISVMVYTNSNFKNVKFTNKTNKFILIDSISFYYGEDIIYKNVNLKLPPQSIVNSTLQLDKIEKGKYLKINNASQVVSLGIAIEYTDLESNKKASLIDIKKVSHKNY